MPNADDDELRRRLTDALDRVQPPYSTPRYASARPRSLAWRLAPAVLAVTALSALVLSAYAGTGSPNPVVWTEKVVNVVQPPAQSTNPTEQTQPSHQQSPSPKAADTSTPPPTHNESAEPAQSPEPSESPEPTDDHGSSPSPGTSTTTTSDSGGGERS